MFGLYADFIYICQKIRQMEEQKTDRVTSKVELIQPNKVTISKRDYDEIEENLLTLTIDAIQDQMTRLKPIQTDLFGHPYIMVEASEAAGGRNKARVFKKAVEMRKSDIDFEWTDKTTGQVKRTNTGLFEAVHDIKGTNFIEITLSVWAIPALLYYGEGVGGTLFVKEYAITLRGEHTKKLYKYLSRWKNQGGYEVSLDEFQGFMLTDYDTTELKRRVLEPAKKKMKEGCDIWFEYRMWAKKGRKKDTITFKIFQNELTKSIVIKPTAALQQPFDYSKGEMAELYRQVWQTLGAYLPESMSDKARVITDLLANKGAASLKKADKELGNLDEKFTDGKISKEFLLNAFGKFLDLQLSISGFRGMGSPKKAKGKEAERV